MWAICWVPKSEPTTLLGFKIITLSLSTLTYWFSFLDQYDQCQFLLEFDFSPQQHAKKYIKVQCGQRSLEGPRIRLQNMFGILVVSQSSASFCISCIYVYICFYIHIYVNIHIQNLYCDININICRCVCMYIQYAEYGPAVFVHAWCFSIISLYMGLFFAWVFSMESVCWLSIQCYTVLRNHSKQIKTQKYIKQKNTQTSLCKIDRWKTMKPHSKHRF